MVMATKLSAASGPSQGACSRVLLQRQVPPEQARVPPPTLPSTAGFEHPIHVAATKLIRIGTLRG